MHHIMFLAVVLFIVTLEVWLVTSTGCLVGFLLHWCLQSLVGPLGGYNFRKILFLLLMSNISACFYRVMEVEEGLF